MSKRGNKTKHSSDALDAETHTGDSGQLAAVFFDLDRTLMAGASAFEFARAAHRAGLITKRRIIQDAIANVRFRLRGVSDEEIEALRSRIGNMLAGLRVRDLARLSPDTLTGVLPRVYPQMLQEAYSHQDAGRLVYICSAAAEEIVNPLVTVLCFDGALATRLDSIDGYYTGKIDDPFMYGEGKAAAIRELAEREGIDLSDSYAYSDSFSDLAMLEVVGHPVAVNPDAPLRKIALDRGWRIMRFEKLGQRLRLAVAITLVAGVSGVSRVLLKRNTQSHSKRSRLKPGEIQRLLKQAQSTKNK